MKKITIITIIPFLITACSHTNTQEENVNSCLKEAKPMICMKKLSLTNNMIAQKKLGDMYIDNSRYSQEDDAIYWYTKSAKQGYAEAQFSLGSLYYIRFEYKKSFYWTKKAVEQGSIPAQLNLATEYSRGLGTAEDPKKALYWYKKSAENGDIKALDALGEIYYYGKGVDKDYKQALYWTKKASKLYNTSSQNRLGYMYAHGEGVEKNKIKAYAWWSLCLDNGNDFPQYHIKDLAKEMSPDEIEQAKAMKKELIK